MPATHVKINTQNMDVGFRRYARHLEEDMRLTMTNCIASARFFFHHLSAVVPNQTSVKGPTQVHFTAPSVVTVATLLRRALLSTRPHIHHHQQQPSSRARMRSLWQGS